MRDAGLEKDLAVGTITGTLVKRLRGHLRVAPNGLQAALDRAGVQGFDQCASYAAPALPGEHGHPTDLTAERNVDTARADRLSQPVEGENMQTFGVALVHLYFRRNLLLMNEHGKAHGTDRDVVALEVGNDNTVTFHHSCGHGEKKSLRFPK